MDCKEDTLSRCRGNLHDALVAALVRSLGSASWAARRKAVRHLGELGPAAGAAVPLVEAALRDADGRVAAAAWWALGRIRAEEG